MDTCYVGARTPMTVAAWLELGWPAEEAERLATHAPAVTKPTVLRVTRDGITPLPHLVRHSPTGFGWGYAGSGPADLALALLLDHLQARVVPDALGDTFLDPTGTPVEIPYQAFKYAVVAGLPERGFLLGAGQIAAWLGTRR